MDMKKLEEYRERFTDETGYSTSLKVLAPNAERLFPKIKAALKEQLDWSYVTLQTLVTNDEGRNQETRKFVETYSRNFEESRIMEFLKDGIPRTVEMREALERVCHDLELWDASTIVNALIDFEPFLADVIAYFGHGYFLNDYDHNEYTIEVDGETFYVYR